ncbi:flavodoxin family protein [Clostridium sp. C8-1-8]|uniref:flavodoxin family protein n=1 Tax=Clostridium sp. C8-1-8 TaxID=2698831 RepID=UPI001370ABB9|nr:flavodoxin family protein [Clostridium sp. C8-1-8]
MKVLALNGSPRGKYGNTEVLLDKFVNGCKIVGADTEVIYLKEKNIGHCQGCFCCWTKTPGKCILKDDMEELLIKVSEADVIVYATPLYYFTVTGIMKDFMDRMLPLNLGEIVENDQNYSHPRRFKKTNPTKTVLISNSGFPGNYNFSGLVETFKILTNGTLAGTILCAQGGVLQGIRKSETLTELYKPYFSALENAGQEILNLGYIKPETQKILDTNVIPSEIYINNANKNWH